MLNMNFWEILLLALLALFIFGPDRLPKLVGDAMRFIRGVRTMARNATQDLSRELGTDVSIEDLNPKTFIRKHVFSDDEQAALRRPFDDLGRDVRSLGSDTQPTTARRPLETPETPDDAGGRHRADPDAT